MSSLLHLLQSDYAIHIAILVCIYSILAESLNLTFGLGRMFNLAHIAVYALGAYSTALLSTEFGYGFFPCLIFSMVLCGSSALLLGWISLRLNEEYFAVGTLAFSSLVTALLINWKSVTRGVLGIPGIPRPVIFGTALTDNRSYLVLSFGVATVVLAALWLIFRSNLGRALRAQAESVVIAQAIGQNTRFVSIQAFIFSSVCVGAAGNLYAFYMNYIDPTSFNLNEMVFVLSIVVVGRPGSFWGTITATIFLVLLPELLRFPSLFPRIIGDILQDARVLGPMRQMLYAMTLFTVIFWKRAVLFPKAREI